MLHLFPLTTLQAQGVHAILELGAFSLGGWLWRRARRHRKRASEAGFPIAVGCIFGAGLGNKLVAWIQSPQPLWSAGVWHLPGQSMVGGLLGGWLGVELVKKATGSKRSTGDDFVLPLLAGIALGRIGCFLAGLHEATYGLPTALPWAVDLGDGIGRHPAPLYETIFAAILAVVLSRLPLPRVEGLRFRICAASYLFWRLAVDLLKPAPWKALGLSGIQWTCLAGLVWAGTEIVTTSRKPRNDSTQPTA